MVYDVDASTGNDIDGRGFLTCETFLVALYPWHSTQLGSNNREE